MLFIIITLTCLVLQFFLPWWIAGVVAFIFAAWLAKNAFHAFSFSFLAIFSLWVTMSFIQSIPNQHVLANRVGQMFKFPEQGFNWLIILFLTGCIGGLAAGVSGLAGFYCRQAVSK